MTIEQAKLILSTACTTKSKIELDQIKEAIKILASSFTINSNQGGE